MVSRDDGKSLENSKMKVFLGGTCNESTWRDDLINMLKIDYFNPVVDDWTPACLDTENREKETCDYLLFVVTKAMTGVYSIAEVVDASNKAPQRTILCILYDGFSEGQKRSLKAVEHMVCQNGAVICSGLRDAARFLNTLGRIGG
jgi:hypothetical protein